MRSSLSLLGRFLGLAAVVSAAIVGGCAQGTEFLGGGLDGFGGFGGGDTTGTSTTDAGATTGTGFGGATGATSTTQAATTSNATTAQSTSNATTAQSTSNATTAQSTSVTTTAQATSNVASSSSGGGGICDDTGDCNTCQECALNDPCFIEVLLCDLDFECPLYWDCLNFCADQACADGCAAAYPFGALVYNDMAVCVLCDNCYNDCDGANIGCP